MSLLTGVVRAEHVVGGEEPVEAAAAKAMIHDPSTIEA